MKSYVIVMLIFSMVIISGCSEKSPPVPMPPVMSDWAPHASNPILSNVRQPDNLPPGAAPVIIWNDPYVMKEGDTYSMWVSKGSGAEGVVIHKLTSQNGIDWTVDNNGAPVLEPGDSYDSNGVETPAVIKVNGVYHMYYSFFTGGSAVSMAHATSPDGIIWTKRGELTSLTGIVDNSAGNQWGWLARAEPASVYHDNTFYLYFTDVKCRQDNCQGTPRALRGISLATSTDGHTFAQSGNQPVLLQSDSYRPGNGWEGYSTPWVYHNGETFELYVDVFRTINDTSMQTAIAHYRSEDGINFGEVAADIITIHSQPWAGNSVRAPAVIEDNGVKRMWYAGEAFNPATHTFEDLVSGRVLIGVGTATSEIK